MILFFLLHYQSKRCICEILCVTGVCTNQSLDTDSGWRESPLAHSVEHWPRKPKGPEFESRRCNTIFHYCISICDNGGSNVDSVFLCVAKIFLVKLAKVRLNLQSRGRDSSWRGNMSQVFVRTSRLILTRLEGIPFSSFGRALAT